MLSVRSLVWNLNFSEKLHVAIAQCAYNSAKAKNKFHFWGSKWSHGDTLLFSLASAQVEFNLVYNFQSDQWSVWLKISCNECIGKCVVGTLVVYALVYRDLNFCGD